MDDVKLIDTEYGFEIYPSIDSTVDNKYNKVNLSSAQKAQILTLAGQLAKSYKHVSDSTRWVLKFPDGFGPANLMNLKAGGQSTVLLKNGKIAGHAQLFGSATVSAATVAVAVFEIMSVVTQQYYLTEITNKLNDIENISKAVLDFLHDEKKSELMSEIEFVNSAFKNYNIILPNSPQSAATITSLQATEKTALKNCAFYAENLKKTIFRNNHIEEDVNTSFSYCSLLEISLKLYLTSKLLGIYYSQNYDRKYIDSVKTEMLLQINKNEGVIHSSFEHLKKRVNETYDTWFWRYNNRGQDLEKIFYIISESEVSDQNAIYKNTLDSFDQINMQKEYLISSQGDIYLKVKN